MKVWAEGYVGRLEFGGHGDRMPRAGGRTCTVMPSGLMGNIALARSSAAEVGKMYPNRWC